MTTDFTWSGLSGPADFAHVHDAAPGQTTDGAFKHEVLYVAFGDPGPVVDCWVGSCVPPSGSTHNVFSVDATNVMFYLDFPTVLARFEAGDMYIDIHTQNYTEGEIRGQFAAAAVLPEPSGMGTLAMAGVIAASLGTRQWRRRDRV